MSVDSAVSWKNLTGYLWLCCYSCDKYISTKNGDNERLKEPAVLWKRLGLRDIVEPPEKWPVTAAVQYIGADSMRGIVRCRIMFARR